jgi:hypothetical protein
MTRPVQNKTQLSVQLSISTTGAINQKFDALTDNLRFLHSLHNKTISFNLVNESTNSVFVRAVPLDAVVSHILQESAISPQYSAAPRGRPWEPRIAAGITALQQHRHSLAVSALQSSGPRIITTRKEALVRYLSKHRIFKQLPSDAELSTLFNL